MRAPDAAALPCRVEAEAWSGDVRRQLDQGTCFFSPNQYLFQARKPG